IYIWSSTSVIVAPEASLINNGVPPTPRNARTGELTPPGINSRAWPKSFSDLLCCRLDCISRRITPSIDLLCTLRVFRLFRGSFCFPGQETIHETHEGETRIRSFPLIPWV